MSYFKELPDLEYQSFLSDRQRSDDYVRVKNLFRRGKLRDDISNVLTVFDKYQIPDGYRPDNVAEELYKSAEYDWVVLISAGIINIRDEWPISDADLYGYVYKKYGEELFAVHHYVTTEVKDSNNRLILREGEIVNNILQLPFPSYASEITPEELDIQVNVQNKVVFGNLYLHDSGTVVKTEKYGIFVINESQNLWTYTANEDSLDNVEFEGDTTIVSDTLEYISTDGFLKTITIQIEIDKTNPEPTIEIIINSNSVNSTQISYITYFDSGLNSYETKYNITKGITNYEHEVEINEQKRSIYVLKPFYLQQFINDTRSIMKYKKSSQLVEDADGNDIIRTENTRNTIPYGSTFPREAPSEVITIELASGI